MAEIKTYMFEKEPAYEKALHHFATLGGMKNMGHKEGRALDGALDVFRRGGDGLCLRASVAVFNGVVPRKKGVLELDGILFPTKASLPDKPLRVYAFLTNGGFCEGKRGMQLIYADIWGNAFALACRDLVLEQIKELEKDVPCRIDGPYGPGIGGRGKSQLPDYFRLLDGESIGLQLNKAGRTEPNKCAAGLWIVQPE